MSDCPCKAEDIMAEAKTKKATKSSDIPAQLAAALAQMAAAAETSTGDDLQDAARRQCILKLDATIKFIEARW
jgi:hypothetical protein